MARERVFRVLLRDLACVQTQVPAVGDHVDAVAWIEAHHGLVESLGMVVVRVRTENVEIALFPVAPLGHQVPGTVPEAAAAIDHDVEAVGCLDPATGGPAPVNGRFGQVETLPVGQQGFTIDRPAENFFYRGVEGALFTRFRFEVGKQLPEQLHVGVLAHRHSISAGREYGTAALDAIKVDAQVLDARHDAPWATLGLGGDNVSPGADSWSLPGSKFAQFPAAGVPWSPG